MKLAWDAAKRTEKRDGGYHRERSDDPYHTFRWTRLSRVWRMEHPLCEECRKRGIVKRAEVVDHIIPWPVCRDFFDIFSRSAPTAIPRKVTATKS